MLSGWKACVSVLSCCVVGGAAWGGPLKASDIDPGAKVVFHVDMEAVAASEVFAAIAEGNETELVFDLGDLVAEMREAPRDLPGRLGEIDMMRDIHSITAYVLDDDDDPDVVIVRTSGFVTDAVEALREAGVFSAVTHEGLTMVHAAEEDTGEEFFAFVRPEGVDRYAIVLSDSLERVARAAAVVQADAGVVAEVGTPMVGSMAYVFAADAGDLIKGEDLPVRLGEDASLELDVGEAAGVLRMALDVETGEERLARDLGDMLTGFMAMGRMAAANDPDTRPLVELLNGVRVERAGPRLNVSLEVSTERALRLMGDVRLEQQDAGDGDGGDGEGDAGDESEGL
jgi:rhodanese-related sulfurtransferase